MARIIAFSVDGLAGRDGAYSRELQRDVNVFHGINGSGKTTLLKILHSALSVDTSILAGLPFNSAEVDVHLNRHNSIFKRKFAQPATTNSQVDKPAPTLSLGMAAIGGLGVRREKTGWTSEPVEPSGETLTHYRRGYLPISRLYRAVGTGPSRVKAMSEEELDARFAEQVERIWAEYYADISYEISQVQEKGLASILHFVMSGEEPDPQDSTELDSNEAYERVSAFLSRQTGLAGVLDSPQDFENKYKREPQLRGIVKQINSIEKLIEQVTAPRNRLKELLESMYGGNKRIKFSEKEISVEISGKGKIRLPSLSSGEKQLFFISLAALQSGNNSLIIDEPELSMHVDWQRKLVVSLQELNPAMQLIMATHSPEITADLPDKQVFRL
jgi:ABC-type lipoprotein export system ATPase subunit